MSIPAIHAVPSAIERPAEAARFIYVHMPFCEQKCGYCDFFTITDPDRSHPLSSRWLDLCIEEAILWREVGALSPDAPIETVFFGGGTPSLLDPVQIRRLLNQLASIAGIASDAEISLETQPGTADGARITAFADAGVNRFSVGVQTFHEKLLLPTGRRHTVQDSRETLIAARATGKLVSLDLICALPGQTFEEWREDLDQALGFQTPHISVYELTYHAGTEYTRDLKKGNVQESVEEERIRMFEHTRATLSAAGYEHYEISNYAKPGARSRHNQNYWKLGNFVGLGAGAHSFLFPHRYANANSASAYARRIDSGLLFASTTDTPDADIFLIENLQMALRLTEGVDLEVFAARFGNALHHTRAKQLAHLEESGLLIKTGTRIRLTREGQLRSDSILEYLL